MSESQERLRRRRNKSTALSANALALELHRKPRREPGMLWEMERGKKVISVYKLDKLG